MKNVISTIFFMLVLLVFPSCKKFLEVDLPLDKNTANAVFKNPTTAIIAMTGIYGQMGNDFEGGLVGRNGVACTTGELADELAFLYGDPFYLNNLNGNSEVVIWNNSYRILIFRINSVIEGVSNSSEIPEDTKSLLIGEAKFARAFVYFNLVNLYGAVPMVLTTDFTANSNIKRAAVKDVYAQIIADLLAAQAALKDEYLETLGLNNVTHSKRVRPNRATATALLARVYLYTEQWNAAADEATKIINKTGVYSLLDLDRVFLKNSDETIWALQPTVTDRGSNCPDAYHFITRDSPPVSVSINLINAFEKDDKRLEQWITTIDRFGQKHQVPYKYKIGEGDASQSQEEYTVVFRLAEQYLIRAEAKAHSGSLIEAKADIDVLRKRAGLEETSAATQDEILDAIAHERQVELFSEWGHRWFDLKRTGKINEVMEKAVLTKVLSDGTRAIWQPFKALMPIPYEEFKYNPALIGFQNPGYLESQ